MEHVLEYNIQTFILGGPVYIIVDINNVFILIFFFSYYLTRTIF